MTFPKCKNCGSRNLANEEGEIVCRNCGAVDIEQSVSAHIIATEIIGKASTASDHNPVDALKIVEIGSQQDMSSKATIGTAMELCDPRGKDHEKHKISPGLLNFPYVTGQAVGKNAMVVEIPGFNVWYSCGDSEQFEYKYNPDAYCRNKHTMKYIVFASPIALHHHIVEVYEHAVPKAKRNYRDDTIYRKNKISANAIASKLGMDDVTRRYYGQELNKVFDEFVSTTDFVAVLALLRLQMNYPGLDVKLSNQILPGYEDMLEKLRLFATAPLDKAQLVTA